MPLNLAAFQRPNSASIFVQGAYQDRQSGGAGAFFRSFVLENTVVTSPNHVRLDLTKSHSANRAASVSRSPVERHVVDNVRIEPESVTITGSLSATPLGLIASVIGSFGQYVRRDLREVEKLRQIQARREPVVLVTKERVYQSMVFSIQEEHVGTNKVDLTLQFDEVRIVTPRTVTGVTDLDELLAAEQNEAIGRQSAQQVTTPTALAGGGFGA